MLAHALRTPTFTGYHQLSKSSQLLLADCIARGVPELELSGNEPALAYLRERGWLVQDGGIRAFSIPPEKWRELVAMKNSILTPSMIAEVRNFQARKPLRFGR